MHEVLVTVGIVVLTAGAVIGAAAIITGWILPGPGRAKVLRPKVWGYGTLIGQAGFGTFLFLGPLRGPDIHNVPFALTGMAVAFLGLYVQRQAMKPATKTSA